MNTVPEGFKPFKLAMGFVGANGPLYGKWDGAHLKLGFRVEERHCNPGMIAHGGMLATFADMQLPFAARFQADADVGFLPTVNLTCDFLAPARLGVWVEGQGDVMKATRNLLFVHGMATADGEPILRMNGIFKITSKGSTKAGDITVADLFDFPKS